MNELKWKDSEKKIANRAFESARIVELNEIVHAVKADATKIDDADELWVLMDQMKDGRYQFEQKYDYRYSVLVSVAAIAVGMPVTRHPPHRSVRAQLRHTAPTSGI
jgi:hypothetical protein